VLDDLDVLIEGATERQIRRVRIARRPPAEADE
jgi:hypothetical protein